jgi:hypothetical protein
MSSLTLLGDTSGSVILQAPAVAGSGTVTLPTVGGTVLTNTTPGTLLQCISVNIATRYTLNSRSFAAIGPTLSITPRSTSSRILLISSYSIQFPAYTYMTFFRNGTNISSAPYGIITYSSSSGWTNNTMTYIDSPSTTSAVTYQLAMYSSSGEIYLNDYGGDNKTQIIAMEIAG